MTVFSTTTIETSQAYMYWWYPHRTPGTSTFLSRAINPSPASPPRNANTISAPTTRIQ